MGSERTKVLIKKLKSAGVNLEGVTLEIGEIEEEWDEPMGPTPKPGITDLREWDFKLLKRHEPFYSPTCDMCCLCTFGKCDLTKNKKGACGINLRSQQARQIVIATSIGTACHAGHARHMLHHQIERKGRDFEIDLGRDVEVEAPIMRVVIGSKPQTLGDLEKALDYAEEQITHVLSSVHTGQEGDNLELESKAMHVGMIDNLVKEIADIAQVIGYDFPKGDPDAPLVNLGFASVDRTKPVILCIGHNVAPGAEIISYLEDNNLEDSIEVCGICCTAHDLTRRSDSAKVIGPLSRQMKFIKSGIADVIMIDEQCIRNDVLEWAEKTGAPLIATNDKMCMGLKDRTEDNPNDIVKDLVEGRKPGALILDPVKAGEVVVRVAQGVKPKRQKLKFLPSTEEVVEQAKKCVACENCQRACPVNIHLSECMEAATEGDLSKLAGIRERCVGCTRCEEACERDIPIIKMIETAAEEDVKKDKHRMRCGRGPISDVEIRNVGSPIVLGEIPGIVVLAGCSNYPNGTAEIAEIAEEFLKRRFIVVVSGCAAMEIARMKDEEGKSLYERYPGYFDAGGLVNLGSCVANAHILGAAIKVANIFAKRDLRGNFEEIADYIYNRVGAVAVVWGAYSQKALAIGTGMNRWGIPLVLGPQGTKYRRLMLGRRDKEELWQTYDARTGKVHITEPAPEHLVYTPETKEEAIVAIAKLCFRPNDTYKGRQIKLSHYIDLHEKYFGVTPEDIHLYVRRENDIPLIKKEEILKILKEKGWKAREETIDPTIVKRLIRGVKK